MIKIMWHLKPHFSTIFIPMWLTLLIGLPCVLASDSTFVSGTLHCSPGLCSWAEHDKVHIGCMPWAGWARFHLSTKPKRTRVLTINHELRKVSR